MTTDKNQTEPDAYWEKAGEVSHAQAMFVSGRVERHISLRLRGMAIDMSRELGIESKGHVMDFGCGDGVFANEVLARHFQAVDGFDKSEAAIRRARSTAGTANVRFEVADLVKLDYSRLPAYDGAFLRGFLHHVKLATPTIIKALAAVTPRVVVLEPNGDNLIRKALEFTSSYQRRGEDSFRARELIGIFESAGYSSRIWKRVNIFPNFTPEFLFRLLLPLEPRIEANFFLKALCTVNIFGFEKPGAVRPQPRPGGR